MSSRGAFVPLEEAAPDTHTPLDTPLTAAARSNPTAAAPPTANPITAPVVSQPAPPPPPPSPVPSSTSTGTPLTQLEVEYKKTGLYWVSSRLLVKAQVWFRIVVFNAPTHSPA